MQEAEINKDAADEGKSKGLSGAQTLIRGLEILSVVANGTGNLQEISTALGLSRSTAHRLANAMVEQRFLNFTPRIGYSLGAKLIELGHRASQQMSLPRVAYEHIALLATATGDTVHLGVLDNESALYLDKISGSRRIEISSRIGERQPLSSTGLGKALLLDHTKAQLETIFNREQSQYHTNFESWFERMQIYSRQGCAFDLEENEDRIRCVAAPIRNAANKIIGSISVASAAQYMDDNRMNELKESVIATANAISFEYGWQETTDEKNQKSQR
jgi:DNA-binding IclR family transcriptional regulator